MKKLILGALVALVPMISIIFFCPESNAGNRTRLKSLVME